MIEKPELKKLVNRYLLDSEVLLNNRRYASSVYLCGYALELALKYKICKLLRFGNGYPENPVEFNSYSRGRSKFIGTTIRSIRDLKIHNFAGLLFFKGEQINFTTNFSTEWNTVIVWDVFIRYNPAIVRKTKALSFYYSVKKLTHELV